MIKISLRLKAIADLVDVGSKVIDVGCDHGLLDVYLAEHKSCECLATDVSKTCILKAQDNIKKYHLEDKISTKVTDGLQNINYNQYDYVIISGMGFQTISKILDNCYPNKLIIQSNNNIEELKQFLFKKYKLIEEKVIFENDIYYVVLLLEKGKQKYKYSDYVVVRDKNNKEYIDYIYHKYQYIYNKLPKKYIIKRLSICRKLKALKKYKKTLI